jgi:hypothetical protein
MTKPPSLIWPRRTMPAIAFWCALWTLFIAGVGVIMVIGRYSDARFRENLARHGVVTQAVIGVHDSAMYQARGGCGKGSHAAVRFAAQGERPITRCAAMEDLPGPYTGYAVIAMEWPDAPVQVVYDPKMPSHFVVAPGGRVPMRVVTGIWWQWARNTAIVLAIFLPCTALYVWRRRA